MIPAPLNKHRKFSEAQNLLVGIGIIKQYNFEVEWHDDIFIINRFTNVAPNAYTDEGRLLELSKDSYNNTVRMLFESEDPELLGSVYVMISTISPLGLLRKRLFGESERVSKVDSGSSRDELADCRMHLDLLGNLYRAAMRNPLSSAEGMQALAKRASRTIEGMEGMYMKASGDGRREGRKKPKEPKEPEELEGPVMKFSDVRLVSIEPRRENYDK